MNKSIENKTNKNGYKINIIVFAQIIAGFTELRFGFFGFSEIVILLTFFYLVFIEKTSINIKKMVFTRFWFLTILFNCIGMSINTMFQIDYSSIDLGSAWFDLLSYFYILILCFTVETILIKLSYNEIWSLIKKIFYTAISIVFILFIISRFKQTIFGFSLFYGGIRFSPLADNPHQINILTSTLPFLGFKILKENKSIKSKMIAAIFIAAGFTICLSTLSDTMKVVYLVCFYLMLTIFQKGNFRKKPKFFLLIFVTIIFLLIIILFYDYFLNLLIKFFEEGDSGGVRFLLWRNSLKAGMYSPLFGLGPGAHTGFYGPFESVESHQIFLTMYTQSGLMGVILLISLIIKIIKGSFKDKYIFIVTIGLLISTLTGTMLRRVILWMYLMIYYHFTSKSELSDSLKCKKYS